jgi:hypothetical protein
MNQKYYVTTILMPDDQLYVGINEYLGDEEKNDPGFIMVFDNELDADDYCEAYAMEHDLPTFANYKEDYHNA